MPTEIEDAVRPGGGARHYSGIVVFARPDDLDRCRRDLEELPGIEVRHLDRAGGRLVAVQETGTAEAQQDGLRRIQALPRVRLAALVEHRIDHEPELGEGDER